MEENAENCSLLFFFLTFSSIIFFLPLSFHIQIRSWRYHRGIVIPGKYTDSVSSSSRDEKAWSWGWIYRAGRWEDGRWINSEIFVTRDRLWRAYIKLVYNASFEPGNSMVVGGGVGAIRSLLKVHTRCRGWPRRRAWSAHTWSEKRRNTSTQFKLSISLASVSGYRATVTWWSIDYSGPAKSNYTTHTHTHTYTWLTYPPLFFPNKLTAWNINPFPCVCLCLSFRLRPLTETERNIALQGPRVSFWRVMALFRALEICYTTLPLS